jgi:hypothetical protein
MSPQNAVFAIAIAWIGVGLGVAAVLHKQGHSVPTAISALVAWPALLPVLGSGVESTGAGPYSARIAQAFAALRLGLAEPTVAGLTDMVALAGIESSLHRADARIAAVDRLLADPAVATDSGAERLRLARAKAAAEVETVLSQLVHVRVQLGLVALAGDTSTVRAHLSELAARARALEEVAVC